MSINNSGDIVWAKSVAILGLLLIVVATGMPLFIDGGSVFKYVYSIGALMVLVGRIFNRCPVDDLRVKRLYRIEVWSGIIFCVGAFFMFYTGAGAMDWMAFTLAGGAIEVYASLMIPRAMAAKGKKTRK